MIEIYTVEDFFNIKNDMTADYILMNDLNFLNLEYTHRNLIESNAIFSGSLNGNNKTLKNINNRYSSIGIFQEIGNKSFVSLENRKESIFNLNIENSSFLGSGHSYDSVGLGVLASKSYNCIINNCNILVNVEANKNFGLIGKANNTTFRNIKIDFKFPNNYTLKGDYYLGTLSGLVSGNIVCQNINSKMEIITNSFYEFNNPMCFGGIIGQVSDESNLNISKIEINNIIKFSGSQLSRFKNFYFGGIIGGINSNTLVDSKIIMEYIKVKNEIEIENIDNNENVVIIGGFIGKNMGNLEKQEIEINNCYITGNINTQYNYSLINGVTENITINKGFSNLNVYITNADPLFYNNVSYSGIAATETTVINFYNLNNLNIMYNINTINTVPVGSVVNNLYYKNKNEQVVIGEQKDDINWQQDLNLGVGFREWVISDGILPDFEVFYKTENETDIQSIKFTNDVIEIEYKEQLDNLPNNVVVTYKDLSIKNIGIDNWDYGTFNNTIPKSYIFKTVIDVDGFIINLSLNVIVKKADLQSYNFNNTIIKEYNNEITKDELISMFDNKVTLLFKNNIKETYTIDKEKWISEDFKNESGSFLFINNLDYLNFDHIEQNMSLYTLEQKVVLDFYFLLYFLKLNGYVQKNNTIFKITNIYNKNESFEKINAYYGTKTIDMF